MVMIAAVALVLIFGAVFAAVRLWPRDDATGRGAIAVPTPSAAAPSPSADGAAARKALDAYGGYRRVYNAAAADPAGKWDLKRYAGSPLRLEAGIYLQQLARDGLRVKGEPRFSPRVTQVASGGKAVTITDCYDSNGSATVEKATGKVMSAPGQLQRYVITATVEEYGDGSWLVSKITADRKKPC